MRTAAPDWAVTADLSLRLFPHRFVGPASVVEATGSVVRTGRRAIVMEVDVVGGGLEGGPTDGAAPIGHATMSFTVMTRNESNQVTVAELDEASATRFTWPPDEPPVPYFDLVGLTRRRRRRLGAARRRREEQLRRPAGRADRIDPRRGGRGRGRAGGRTVAIDAYYLGLGRVGPFLARGTVLGGSTVRVELRDTGADDRLMTVALAAVEPIAAVAAA